MTGVDALPRSYLYVPGNAEAKLAGALGRGADAIIVDLEDAVPLAEKEAARESVVRWIGALPAGLTTEVWVRVNPGVLRELDVAALAGLAGLTGIALAKAESRDDVEAVAAQLVAAGDTTTRLMPVVESAVAVLGVGPIAAGPRVHQLQIGEVDLAGDTGITPGEDEVELLTMRTMVVLASVAAGIAPPVGPVSRITADPEALRRSTERVQRLGFVGRACIHPAQVSVVHEVFRPAAEEVEEARTVLRLVDEAEATGSGVVLDPQGRLVDPAVVAGAQRTLALARRGGA
ncbi:MAG: CoA ester lyase [Aeromicrobium sp.]|uniref:HpcH/HpaI aldolase/citrate lyase family protein n=1 Tax=Aeromicrobium sp. TaxID=1871063 RepID=UPI00260E7E30|nr:CoA ester lyase [Aeromicrobium sp.]MDF1704685.1 CoA ester lyase [Aeromicrobium sp.]